MSVDQVTDRSGRSSKGLKTLVAMSRHHAAMAIVSRTRG